jgi:sporulation protein YlmC with PRC-barrel domain
VPVIPQSPSRPNPARGREFRRRHMADTNIEIDETLDLIASNKVEGTAVYDNEEQRLGTIYNVMIDKVNGQVEYAVLSFGGLFGLGSNYYPIPWEMLEYDTNLGGYVVDIAKEKLQSAPSYSGENQPTFDRAYGTQIYDYYGLEYPRA